LVRLSVGIEDVRDILADLEQGLGVASRVEEREPELVG
jgi:cystathionine beta-lyase/cystathionine gamma-synthase